MLSKFEEGKVSTGDQDGGRSDFNDPLLLLDFLDDNLQAMPSNIEDHEASLENEEWKEGKSSFCMYLGQISNVGIF